MSLSTQKMHDATLLAIRFDWMSRTCTFDFAGAPTLLEPFVISFFDVTACGTCEAGMGTVQFHS